MYIKGFAETAACSSHPLSQLRVAALAARPELCHPPQDQLYPYVLINYAELMDTDNLEAQLLALRNTINKLLICISRPDADAEIHDAAAAYPSHLIPTDIFYRQLHHISRRKIASTLLEAGYARVKKEQGIFWVKP